MLRFTTTAVAIALFVSGNVCHGQPNNITTAAKSGDMFGGETLTSFSQFIATSILPGGETVFPATTSSGEQAIIVGTSVALLTGTQVSGAAPGVVYDFGIFPVPVVNDLGDFVMAAAISGPGIDSTNNDLLIEYTGGTVNVILSEGDPAVGTSDGSLYGPSGGLRYTSGGGIGVTNFLQNAANDIALYSVFSPPELQAKTGTVASDGAVLLELSNIAIGTDINGPGFEAFFTKFYVHPDTQAQRAEIVGSSSGSGLAVLWETGNNGFNLPTGTTAKDFLAISGPIPIDHNSGTGQFGAFVQFEGATFGTSLHLFEFDDTGITDGRPVALTGQLAPELPGHRFDFFSNFILGSARGVVAFYASASRPPPGTSPVAAALTVPDTVQGIWFQQNESGPVQLAGFGGQQAPGLAEGVTLDQLRFPAINALGQVAFKSNLAGPGIEIFTNDVAAWATDLNGDLQLVVRTGDLFDVDDDPIGEDLRTINAIGEIANSGGTGGQSTSFNDAGQLALMLNFTDFTSGIFVFDLAPPTSPVDVDNDGDVDGNDFLILQRTNPSLIPQWETEFGNGAAAATVAVPEPATGIMLMLGVAAILLRRCEVVSKLNSA